jgi:glutamate racemase
MILHTTITKAAIPASAQAPIGVFDSGLGGLSVLREIRQLLPHEDLLYVADSAHVPYGDKPESHIRARSLALAQFLYGQGAKAIVVACNTATAAAVSLLREELPVPVIGMEPALKPAVAATRSGVVGVLATVGTLASARFAALLARYAGDVEVITQPCPGLVEQVELGDLDGPLTQALVRRYTVPLLARGADTLILGCTHYPFLHQVIAEIAGPHVSLIHTGPAVARQVQRVLTSNSLLCLEGRIGQEQFWTSGERFLLQTAVNRLWHQPVSIETLPEASAQRLAPATQALLSDTASE